MLVRRSLKGGLRRVYLLESSVDEGELLLRDHMLLVNAVKEWSIFSLLAVKSADAAGFAQYAAFDSIVGTRDLDVKRMIFRELTLSLEDYRVATTAVGEALKAHVGSAALGGHPLNRWWQPRELGLVCVRGNESNLVRGFDKPMLDCGAKPYSRDRMLALRG